MQAPEQSRQQCCSLLARPTCRSLLHGGDAAEAEDAMSRKMIAALQISLDGFTQGSDKTGEEWVDSWADALALIPDVDAFVQGANMYPGYGDYWASIESDPERIPPFLTRLPYEHEIAYAHFAAKTPHFVLSKTLDRVSWPPTARIVRDLAALRALKEQPGKNIYVVGGPTLVTSLLNADLLDELRLIVHPLLLGGGKPLFEGANRRSLHFVQAEPSQSGKLILTYRT
jgi:dihydrofolate reductase